MAVKVPQADEPVWHTDTALVPATIPVKLSCEPVKFKVKSLGLEMLEI